MFTPLEKTPLKELLTKPVLFDANIFMVGIEERFSNKDYSFQRMTEVYIQPLFESFTDIYIHQEVYNELDDEARFFVDHYVGKNVTIVQEGGLYGTAPLYTTIFNQIANHELVNYTRGQAKDRGEVYSLAYAAYHNMNYFCSKEIMVDNVAHELKELENIDVITFDVILLMAYVYHAKRGDTTYAKALKALYKRYGADVIKRHRLPPTLSGYIKECQHYL